MVLTNEQLCYDSDGNKYRILEVTRNTVKLLDKSARGIMLTCDWQEFFEDYWLEEPFKLLKEKREPA